MRELSAEEKAKAYDKVREKIDLRFGSNVAEEIFSQFEESEDERIRKTLIEFFGRTAKYNCSTAGISDKDILVWLEKQGEKTPVDKIQLGKKYKCIASPRYSTFMTGKIYKPEDKFLCSLMNFCSDCFEPIEDGEQNTANNVEPKFKKGDWVVYDHRTYQVVELPKEGYINLGLRSNGKIEFAPSPYCRHWTIQDAKDGDVLVMQKTRGTYENIFIFNKIENNRIIQYLHYFITDTDEEVCEARSIDGFLGFVGTNVHPATVEQRDILFQKMKEVGYEWDADKKELKKIELHSYQWNISDFRTWQYIVSDVLTKHDGIGQYLDNGLCNKIAQDMQEEWSKKLCSVQHPSWSEEDEEMHRKCICAMRASACGFPEEEKFVEQVDNWLNSLKGKVQPKQEWSEEDEKNFQDIDECIVHLPIFYKSIKVNGEDKLCMDFIPKIRTWLKSIKNRVLPQPKQEWSKEDEGILLESISVLQNNSHWILADKLKSLKDKVQLQNRWKPNGLDILLLERIANGESNPQDFQASLGGLILQLKKLREE